MANVICGKIFRISPPLVANIRDSSFAPYELTMRINRGEIAAMYFLFVTDSLSDLIFRIRICTLMRI